LSRHKNARGAAEKLALFEKLKARGAFACEDRAELLRVERMLRTFAATEKGLNVSGTLKAGCACCE
jgi:hypothetical protein